MDIGIFAKVFTRADLDETLHLIRGHELHSTQFNMSCVGLPSMPEQIPPELACRIKSQVDDHDIKMVAVSGTFNMIHPDSALVADGLKRLGVLAAVSHNMGTNLITLCTGTRDTQDMWRWHPDNDQPEAWNDLLFAMDHALKTAEAHDVALGIEPEHANVVSSAYYARKLLDHFQSPRLKIVIDPANLFEGASYPEHIIEEAFDLLGDSIVIAHAKDRDSNGQFVAAGQGILNYDHYIAQLRRIHFTGSLVLHGLGEQEVKTSVDFLRTKLNRLPLND